VHGAAAERMRMRNERGVQSVRMACVKKGFKTTSWAAKIFDRLNMRTERRHRDECTRGRLICLL